MPRPCVIVKTIEFNLAVLKFSASGSDRKMEQCTDLRFLMIPYDSL